MKRTLTIRRQLLLIGGGLALLVVLGAAGVVGLSVFLSRSDTARLEAYADERETANRVMRGILRQLAAASNPDPVGAFQVAGDEVRAAIASYAEQDLTQRERQELDSLNARHVAMEAEAERSYELFLSGDVVGGMQSWGTETSLGYAFIDRLEDFLALRQEGVEALHQQQGWILSLLFILSGVLGLLVWAGGGVFAWTIGRRVTGPLRRLSEASSRIERGELQARVPVEADTEFRAVCLNFNSMAERLEEMTRDLQDKNGQLTQALEQVRETQADLIQSEKLSAMGRMTAGLAHELNNPLASVLGYTELLNEALSGEASASSPEKMRRELVAPVLQEARRARSLIQEFLQLARKSPADLVSVSIRDTLQRARMRMEQAVKEAGVDLRVGTIPDVTVTADPVMLDGVFINIVSNALDALKEAGNERPRIEVRGEVAGDRVAVTIEDNGPGLEQPDRIFEPFFTTKPVGKGTGLGLALAHQFVEQFGGCIRADDAQHGGARFLVTLPIEKRHGKEETDRGGPASESDAVVTREADDSPGQTYKASPAVAPAHEGPSILVVEDEEALRSLQKRLLDRLNARVFLAGSASEARFVLDEEFVDVVICDVKMPGESGYEFYLSLTRERPDLAERFLFVTGDVGGEHVSEIARTRPDMVIQKPFDVADYLSRVRNLIESAPV